MLAVSARRAIRRTDFIIDQITYNWDIRKLIKLIIRKHHDK